MNVRTKSLDAFERIVARFDSQMFVVTARHGASSAGCLIGFATQCSIAPARFLVCLSKQNATARVAARAEMLVVHPLRRHQHELARLFGEETGEEIDKFAHCQWHPGPAGTPILDGCDWFAGNVVDRVDLGDHIGHVLEITDGAELETASPGPLGFQAVRDLDAGHDA